MTNSQIRCPKCNKVIVESLDGVIHFICRRCHTPGSARSVVHDNGSSEHRVYEWGSKAVPLTRWRRMP